MKWTPYDWLNKLFSFCMAASVGIFSSCGLTIEACCVKQPNKSKLALYKGGCGICGHMHIETFKTKAGLG